MTCIVGLVQDGKVTIGGDSAGISQYNIRTRKDPKIFRVGEFILGGTCSFRAIQLANFMFSPPKVPDNSDVYEYMVKDFVETLRTCLKDGGNCEINSGKESGNAFLVGYKDRLFEISYDFQVGETLTPYNALGCGADFALGAMFELHTVNLTAEEKVKRALRASQEFSCGVREPFIVLSTTN